MSSQRDTQFAGWATATLHSMFHAKPFDTQEADEACEKIWEQVLAQEAYDLACYVLDCSVIAHGDISMIPDLVKRENLSKVEHIRAEIPAEALKWLVEERHRDLNDIHAYTIPTMPRIEVGHGYKIYRYTFTFRDEILEYDHLVKPGGDTRR